MQVHKTAPFAAEYEPAVSLGRRRSPRAPVSLDARIGRGGLDRTLCKVTDLSMHGAGIQTYSELRLGTMIWLALPGIGHIAAKVVWSRDFEAGLEFQNPLTPEAFEILTT
ncbi:MAG: PilZ domain-containing protein [Sphingomonadales bacterium]|nr:MAG: PilZ domain-containing protein [Sphingomonadales bacterium]